MNILHNSSSSPSSLPSIKPSVSAFGAFKRQRTDGDNDEARAKADQNFWWNVPEDILILILRFTTHDPQDLFGLEASCKSLHHAVSQYWKVLAKEDYNLEVEVEDDAAAATTTTPTTASIISSVSSGKDLWKEGRALASLRTDGCRYVYFRNADFDVFRGGVFFGCNRGIVVMSSCEHNTATALHHPQNNGALVGGGFGGGGGNGGGFIPASPIRIRDAKTLKILANMDGSHNHKAVDVLGPSGNEIIIEYLDAGLKGYRNCQVVWEYPWSDPRETNLWCLLSSERAMLVVRNQSLLVVCLDDSTSLPCILEKIDIEHRVECPTCNWIIDGVSFCLQTRAGEISFWKICDHRTSKYRTIKLSVNKCFNLISAGSKHMVTAGVNNEEDDGIYVFDKQGNLLHRLEEDLQRPTPQHSWSPIHTFVLDGGLLVSNSLMGAALCVWNLRTGRLVHRFEQSIDEGHMFRPDNHFVDGTWVNCLDKLPSFDFPFFLLADNDGSLFAWAFPSSPKDYQQLQKVQYQAALEHR